MANIVDPTAAQVAEYAAWVQTRPSAVRAIAERLVPWGLYRMPTGQRVTVVSFDEKLDGRVTLTVHVSADFNLTLFERQVFGVPPEHLEPCDLPADDDITGAILEGEAVEAALPAIRAQLGITEKP